MVSSAVETERTWVSSGAEIIVEGLCDRKHPEVLRPWPDYGAGIGERVVIPSARVRRRLRRAGLAGREQSGIDQSPIRVGAGPLAVRRSDDSGNTVDLGIRIRVGKRARDAAVFRDRKPGAIAGIGAVTLGRQEFQAARDVAQDGGYVRSGVAEDAGRHAEAFEAGLDSPIRGSGAGRRLNAVNNSQY